MLAVDSRVYHSRYGLGDVVRYAAGGYVIRFDCGNEHYCIDNTLQLRRAA